MTKSKEDFMGVVDESQEPGNISVERNEVSIERNVEGSTCVPASPISAQINVVIEGQKMCQKKAARKKVKVKRIISDEDYIEDDDFIDLPPAVVKKAAPEKPVANESAPTKPAATNPAPTKPAAVEPVVKPTTKKLAPTKAAANEAAVNQPSANEPGVKGPTVKPAAKKPTPKKSATKELTVKEIAAKEAVGKEPAAKNPAPTKPAATNPAPTKPAAVEPVVKPTTKKLAPTKAAANEAAVNQPSANEPAVKGPTVKPGAKKPAVKVSAVRNEDVVADGSGPSKNSSNTRKRKLDEDGVSGPASKKTNDGTEVTRQIKQVCEIQLPDGSRVLKKFMPGSQHVKITDLCADLSAKQKADVEAIGFGGILKLRLEIALPSGIVPWLVSNFNPGTCVQLVGVDRYFVTADDVYDVLCLPRNPGRKVVEKRNSGMQLKDSYKARFGRENEHDIPLHLILDRINELKEGGDEFKRLFVIYCSSYFLAPIATGKVDMKILEAIENVDEIKNLDWCTFVLDKMASMIRRYKSNVEYQTCSACVLILLILYLHRFPVRGVLEPTCLPLVQHWTDAKLREKVKMLYIGGGFDRTIMVKGYPISCAGKVKDGHRGKSDVGAQPEIGADSIPEGDEVLQFKIPRGVLTDSKIKSLAKNAYDEALMIVKRNFEVVTADMYQRLEMVKADVGNESLRDLPPIVGTSAELPNQQDDSPPVEESPIEWNDKLIAMVDEACNQWIRRKQYQAQNEPLPSFNLFKDGELDGMGGMSTNNVDMN